MDTLPHEVVRQIVCGHSRADLKLIRLVNKTLASAAAPPLFHTVPVWMNLDSLTHFTALSEHDVLSQYVKKVVLSPLRFLEYEDDAGYQASISDAMEYRPASLSDHALSIGKHMGSRPCRGLYFFHTPTLSLAGLLWE